MMADAAAERKGVNEARFREANEQLDAAAQDLLAAEDESVVPFLCECPRLDCTQVVLVRLSEYAEVRSHERRGFAADGHEDLTIERIVAKNERFTVTEKFGAAADAFVAEGEP